MKNLLQLIAGILLTVLLFPSCISPKKAIYANNLKQGKDTANLDLYTKDLKIQISDQLTIQVSALDKEQVEVFNPLSQGNQGQGAGTNAAGGRGRGYKVNEKGTIELPLVGEIMVAGLTTEDAAKVLKGAISKYIIDPFVSVNVSNFKVTVLGAVGKPGIVSSQTDRFTILDAMAQSGDIQPSALRDRVWVVRDNNGERTYGKINLNSKDLFQSEYFYLRNNDLIYVHPHPLTAYLGANAPVFATIGAVSGLVAIVIALIK